MDATHVPFQYSEWGQLLKKFLHTKIGAFVGFHIGISGFNRIDVKVIRTNGKIETLHGYNSRVNVGAGLCAYLLSGSNLDSLSSPATPSYIALSTNSLTPAATDTTLSGETGATGLGRHSATAGTYTGPASLDASASYVLSNAFTNNSGGAVTIESSAIFDAASGGNLFVEANLSSSVTLQIGDQLEILWTINF